MNNFKKAIPPFKNGIKQSVYKNDLIFNEAKQKKKSIKRKIIWFTSVLITMLSTTSEKSF